MSLRRAKSLEEINLENSSLFPIRFFCVIYDCPLFGYVVAAVVTRDLFFAPRRLLGDHLTADVSIEGSTSR